MPTTYAIIKGNQYFDATTWTGNTATQTIVNSGNMQPDLVWIKNRSSARYHNLYNSVSGVTKRLFSNATDAEQTITPANYLSSFNSNGFSLGLDIDVNESPYGYVGWQWRASNAAAVTNNAGSITSSVSASTTAGFSVVTYTGNGSAGSTVGHGLSSAPKMIILKSRSATESWIVYHNSLGNTQFLVLNATDAAGTSNNAWNSTSPTSSVFTIGAGGGWGTNTSSATYVAYCWSEVPGFSKFGSYTGNGNADGPFIYTGFEPKFVMTKDINSGVQGWAMQNPANLGYNVVDNFVFAQNTSTQDSIYGRMDFLSNGFKLRTNDGLVNANGNTIIYMAFAEMPTKYANAR
jgi:hypothetical protein